jgi:molybdate transport system ATP-binding protein
MSLEFSIELPRNCIDFKLEGRYKNRITAVYGPSGSGKTTFLLLLAGLLKPASGVISLNGRKLTDTSKGLYVPVNKRRIAVVFQEKLLFPHMSVRQNLCFGEGCAKKFGASGPGLNLDTVIELLDLSNILDSRPDRISGGEQQRTAIGRALLCSPELLLLDEPFNAVDNSLRSNILRYIKRLRDELNIPMIVVSHDLPDLQSLTDTVQLIRKGRSEGYGRISEILIRTDLFTQKHARFSDD